jgi:hypothetical protein
MQMRTSMVRDQKDSLEIQTERLADFIKEHFPEEASCIDLSDRKEVIGLVVDLLDRLWRWNN